MVIQGPNINMLGLREPSIYGAMKMEDIHKQMKAVADQSGNEIQECFGTCDGIIVNPAAFTHTSVAIRDALAAVGLPVIEVHISNIARREEFRQKSLVAPITAGQIIGFGPVGYHLAMIGMIQIFEQIKAVKASQEK